MALNIDVDALFDAALSAGRPSGQAREQRATHEQARAGAGANHIPAPGKMVPTPEGSQHTMRAYVAIFEGQRLTVLDPDGLEPHQLAKELAARFGVVRVALVPMGRG